MEVDGGIMRLAMGARPMAAVAILTRQTLVAPRRALFPSGDGETQCSKIHSGEAMDGSSLRSQGAIGRAVLPIAEQQAAIHFQLQTYSEICDAA